MSRGMSRGGSGFPIIIAVLGVLILGVIGIFIYMQMGSRDNSDALNNDALVTMAPTEQTTPIPTVAPATPEPTEEVVVTLPPETPEPTAENEATPTPYITAAPNYDTGTVWINVDALVIHTQANFSSDTVGKIPYATSVTGDKVDSKWMNVSYDGISGYIYLGSTGAGRKCVVYSESALEELEDDPDADEADIVKSITMDKIEDGFMYVTIEFNSPVYSETNGTGDISADCFSITGATLYTSDISGNGEGTEFVRLKMQIISGSANVKVTVKSQKIFNRNGEAAESESETFAVH